MKSTHPKEWTVDGNEAAAMIAYKCNELIAIYPITPSSSMAELADSWAANGKTNVWGTVPLVKEMQSEGGAAGAAHGALLSGAMTTSFTASQGLLLMIPNMFKLAGELVPAVFHVSARAVATHALSIFCDHSDVMATRSTGWGMLFSNSVQEAHDFALIAQAISLKTRIPFLHIFDGFRTSHEVAKIITLSDEEIRAFIDEELVLLHRERGLSPDHPSLRGSAQNPDVFFQSRERANAIYEEAPEIAQQIMDRFGALTGRHYRTFDYFGSPDADRVVVVLGSASATLKQCAGYLNKNGQKLGVLSVHLFRPFSTTQLLEQLPRSTKAIAVLDRTKEPGAAGEPLLEDIFSSLFETKDKLKVIGGRYGLGSKEFTPSMAKAVFDELSKSESRRRFTVGINDDVTKLSLDYDEDFEINPEATVQAIFWGLGADGTVGANKNSIKIIGDETNNYAQGFFVYDSKKSGSVTVSHLRFGPDPIDMPYLIQSANFIGIHQFGFIGRYPLLDAALPAATVLINSPYPADSVWEKLPLDFKRQIQSKNLRVYVIDAYRIAKELGLGNRINTIMQVAFFALSEVLPKDEAIAHIKSAVLKSYGKFGEVVVKKNLAAIDAALEHLHQVSPANVELPVKTSSCDKASHDCTGCPRQLCQNTLLEMIAGRGDSLPVSSMPLDGTFPTDTACLEKRNIAAEIPAWDPSVCVQCGKCVMVCPHAVIRAKLVDEEALKDRPANFKTQKSSWKDHKDLNFTLQVSAEDCTGCALCVEVCPAKNKSAAGLKAINMVDKSSLKQAEVKANWNYFLELDNSTQTDGFNFSSVKNMQLLQPLFEFSGACAGCGETPYLKLMSQLFGERAVIANATGCSSIYGGNLPTTPWAKNRKGKGPAWANSLFEDNAEFGLGMRLAIDSQIQQARLLLQEMKEELDEGLSEALLNAKQSDEAEIRAQRERVEELKVLLSGIASTKAKSLLSLADVLVKRSVWLVGGDGWAYDIGYGGLDHVLASGANVNILVLDTEVYSNTGGQMSKSTAKGAVAKFAAGGKSSSKKDLARLAMSYGNVYVARVAMGANDAQTINAFIEAESYEGPSLIIAYSHCIAHGIDMRKGMNQQKLAVLSGHWPILRFDPRLAEKGQNAFHLDCAAPCLPLEDYYYTETRYRMLKHQNPAEAARLLKEAKRDLTESWKAYQSMSEAQPTHTSEKDGKAAALPQEKEQANA